MMNLAMSHVLHRPIGLLLLVVTTLWSAEPVRFLDEKLHFLGADGDREWQEFEGKIPQGRRLDIKFAAQPDRNEDTLFIRQRDVKLNWNVELNGRQLGTLFPMEADLVQAFAVPAGALREGDNTLSIIPPEGRDDVVVGEVKLASRPPREALSDATLIVRVSDEDRQTALPCRLTVVDANGSLYPMHIFTHEISGTSGGSKLSTPNARPFLAVRPGVIYSTDGTARFGLPAGSYTIYASRGFEYSVRTNRVTLAPGQSVTLQMGLQREVPTPRLASCDTHVHTFTYSRHGDATLEERMATLAGEGIELPIATDHNILTDYTDAARRLNVHEFFTPVVGDEVTTDAGHFNIFPVRPGSPVPNHRILDWPELMRDLRATPGVRVVVLNHPRNIHSHFQPFAATNYNPVTGENRRGPDFSFDAVEVLNSSALQSDLMIGFRDWFALLNYGYRVTAVGSSDSHDVSRYIVGQGRSYVACDDSHPGNINPEEVCRSFLEGRVLVSLGLLAQLTVDDRFAVGDLATGLGNVIQVTVTVLGPSWTRADRVELYANGLKIREQQIEADVAVVEKARVTWIIPRPAHDVHLVAIASGPPVTAPFWSLAKPYQPSSRVWEPRVIGATNPIWLDGDGDGRFTAPRAYAKALLDRAGNDPKNLIAELASFDEAVAEQAASLFQASGRDVRAAEFAEALRKASPNVRRGFANYSAALPP